MDSKKLRINRRQFVVGGTTAAAALATSASSLFAGETREVRDALVSVGYSSGTASFSRRAVRRPVFFQMADRILTGDPAFFRTGARIRIHEFRMKPHEDLSLQVLFSVPELGKKIPFLAWKTGSNGLSFNIPVEVLGTVDFELERRSGSGEKAVVERAAIALTALTHRGAYKLNPGTYALAIRNPGQAEPDWRSIRVGKDKGLVFDRMGEEMLVDFDYLLLTVNYQTA